MNRLIEGLAKPCAQSLLLKNISLTILIFPLLILNLFCDDKNADQSWVMIDPIQCMGNPWEQAWLEENNNDRDLWLEMEEQAKLDVFEEYYESKGVMIYEIRISLPYENTCAACNCPRGDRFHCRVDEDDVNQMLGWGFESE